jgi:hypothetical protein
MKTTRTTQTVNLTKLEKDFIISFYHSVANTLNYSTIQDVADMMSELTINQVKGVFGSLVNKGVFDPQADIYDANLQKYDTIGMTDLISSKQLDEIAKEFGFYFDFEDFDYDYLKSIN